jgi:hypothetical protein
LDSSIIQGPFFCRAVPNPNITIRNFFIAVRGGPQGTQAAFVKENTHDATFIDLDAGEVVVVGYNGGLPVASGVQQISSTDPMAVVATTVPPVEVAVRVLLEDAFSPAGNVLVNVRFWHVDRAAWVFYDAECYTNTLGAASDRDAKVANRSGRGFGWEVAHGAVSSSRPPSTEKVWALCLVQGPFSVPRANP